MSVSALINTGHISELFLVIKILYTSELELIIRILGHREQKKYEIKK